MDTVQKEDILTISDEELYPRFIESVLSDAIGMFSVVESLEETERYRKEEIFRVHVDTAMQFIRVCKQEYEDALDEANTLLESSAFLKLPRLLNLNYHVMGISCKHLVYFEKAVECFMNILKYEKLYHLTHLTAMAYYYIGEIYLLHEGYSSAMVHLKSGIQFLKETKEHEPRYSFKRNLFASIMIEVLYEMEKLDEMEEYVKVIREYSKADKGIMSIYTYKLATLFFYFAKKEYETAKDVFYDILSMCGEDTETKLQQIKIFLALANEAKLGIFYYEKVILDVEEMGESILPYINYYLHKALYEYYRQKGEKKKELEHLEKAFQDIEKEMVSLKKNRVNSFQLVERAFMAFENLSKESKENDKLRERNFELEELSYQDGLTEISNRRKFESCIMELIEQARAKELSMAVFMFDIDRFKLYNDTYGHLEGDRILKKVAAVIKKEFVSANGIYARFGGEEFIAACIGKEEEELKMLGDKVREEVLALKIMNEFSDLGKLSISIGIAYTRNLSAEAKYSLMREADNSLYEAKNSGRNTVVIKRLGVVG